MKLEYESPVIEIFSFNVTDTVAQSDCNTYTGGVCPSDGICQVDVNINPSVL